MTCSEGTWLNSPTSYTYSWRRDASGISGATSSSYKLTSADVNHLITCTVVAHNDAGDSLPAISLPITPLGLPAVGVPINLTPPAISGTAKPGAIVSCSPGTWIPSPTSYRYS